MNWSRLTRICVLGALVMLIWLVWPATRCTVRGMDATPISELDEEHTEAWESDEGRVVESRTFFDRFFGNIRTCYDAHPIGAQDEWKRQVAWGFAGGFVLFGLIGYLTKPRYRTG